MQKLPERVRSGSGVFERRPDLYALPGDETATGGDARLTQVTGDGSDTYVVYEGPPPQAAEAADVIPVFSAGPGGPIAVPTGRVFVRLAKGTRPEERHSEFGAAGFEIERKLSYAPQAAWLRPVDGGVGAALNGVGALEAIPGVVHVELQLLLERVVKR
jgi:hypothetical protein